MTRPRSRWLAALALGSVVLTPVGYSIAAPDTQAQAPHGRRVWLKEKLGLTDDQASQLQGIRQEMAGRGRELGRTLRHKHAELRQLALNGADDVTLKTKMDEVEKLLAQGLELRVEGLRRMAPVLTQEQRDKLAQMTFGHHGGHRRLRQPQSS